jgi:hypothetical protein
VEPAWWFAPAVAGAAAFLFLSLLGKFKRSYEDLLQQRSQVWQYRRQLEAARHQADQADADTEPAPTPRANR